MSRPFRFRARPTIAATALWLCLLTLPPGPAAQVETDGTVGPAASLSGPDYWIPEELGTLSGPNLFHSFRQFSIFSGESATFTGSEEIRRVISRVTGGEASTIDGWISSWVGTADFFFINPAGVVFGPDAAVDVPAAFHAGTADALQFADGTVFSAAAPDGSTLSASPPEAFGFLSPRPEPVVLDGSRLLFPPGSTVSLAGGDVTIAGTGEREAGIIAPGGDIRISAWGGKAGRVPMDGGAEADPSGAVRLEYARLQSSGPGGGGVTIRAGRGELFGATVAADNREGGAGDGGVRVETAGPLSVTAGGHIRSDAAGGDAPGIEITAGGRLDLLDGGRISSTARDDGDGGPVAVHAGALRIEGSRGRFTGIAAQAESGAGDAGAVDLRVDGLLEMGARALISSAAFADGDAGAVAIRAGEIRIDAQGIEDPLTRITSSAEAGSRGDAGPVAIVTGGSMTVLHGAQILSNTFSQGAAGAVTIRAGALRLDGVEGRATGIGSQTAHGTGDAGSVAITVDGPLDLTNGGIISTGTFGAGNGGRITVHAGEATIQGDGAPFTGIAGSAEPGSGGDAGTLEVRVDGDLRLIKGGQILSSTFSRGEGGAVHVRAGTLRIDGAGEEINSTGIAATSDLGASADGGSVAVAATDLLEIANGGQISSAAFSGGDAGTVTVSAGALGITGGEDERLTGITSLAETGAAGAAGDIAVTAREANLTDGGRISIAALQVLPDGPLSDRAQNRIEVEADHLRLDRGARITAESTGNVPAGSVRIRSGRLTVSDGGQITTAANEADGGPISLRGEVLILRDGRITTSVAGPRGDGGDITLQGRDGGPSAAVVLDGGFVQANTAARGARGGDIFVDVRALIGGGGELSAGGTARRTFRPGTGENVIQAAAPGGEQGTIDITAPDLDISGALVRLSARFADPVRLATEPCVAAGGRSAGSLVHRGRGGLPPDPSEASAVRLGGTRLERLMETVSP